MIEELRKKLGDQVEENEVLAHHTTFKIGGPAKYFFVATSSQDLVKALRISSELNLKYFILGGGSNLLVSDQGFDGFVIKQENKNFKIEGQKVDTESGVLIGQLLNATLSAGLVGWSWVAGLPGTVGGAIRGNAGAYGQAMSNIVESVDAFVNGEIRKFNNQQAKFSYRHSIFKENQAVIISAVLILRKGDEEKERQRVQSYIKYRLDTQPYNLPSAGCVFKNIDLNLIPTDRARITKALDVSEAEYQEATKHNKLPISFIFDKLGLKGKKIGGAQVSEKHAAFIVNAGGATAEHVIMLISDLKMHVRNELGIQLQEEVQYVGF